MHLFVSYFFALDCKNLLSITIIQVMMLGCTTTCLNITNPAFYLPFLLLWCSFSRYISFTSCWLRCLYLFFSITHFKWLYYKPRAQDKTDRFSDYEVTLYGDDFNKLHDDDNFNCVLCLRFILDCAITNAKNSLVELNMILF